MDVEMEEARLDSKSPQVHRRMAVVDRDEAALARLGKKQVLKVICAVPSRAEIC